MELVSSIAGIFDDAPRGRRATSDRRAVGRRGADASDEKPYLRGARPVAERAGGRPITRGRYRQALAQAARAEAKAKAVAAMPRIDPGDFGASLAGAGATAANATAA